MKIKIEDIWFYILMWWIIPLRLILSKVKITKIETYIYNNKLWYHIYYKHTKQHKKDLRDTYNRSVKFMRGN